MGGGLRILWWGTHPPSLRTPTHPPPRAPEPGLLAAYPVVSQTPHPNGVDPNGTHSPSLTRPPGRLRGDVVSDVLPPRTMVGSRTPTSCDLWSRLSESVHVLAPAPPLSFGPASPPSHEDGTRPRGGPCGVERSGSRPTTDVGPSGPLLLTRRSSRTTFGS